MNFHSELYEVSPHEIDMGFGGLKGRGRKKQDPTIERDLYLTLEEVFKGCVKKMKISRRVNFCSIIAVLLHSDVT